MFSPQGAAFPPLQQEPASAGRSWAAASCVQTKQLAGGLGEPPSCLGSSYISVVTYWFSFSFFFLFQCHVFLLASEKALPPTHLLRENKNKWVVRQRRQQRNASDTLTGPRGVILNPVPTACHICVNATVHQACIFFIFFLP